MMFYILVSHSFTNILVLGQKTPVKENVHGLLIACFISICVTAKNEATGMQVWAGDHVFT